MQRATGLRRPGRKEAPELACAPKPDTVRFRMTARTRSPAMAVHHLPWRRRFWRRDHPAAVMEDLFEANSWGEHGATASTATCIITPES